MLLRKRIVSNKFNRKEEKNPKYFLSSHKVVYCVGCLGRTRVPNIYFVLKYCFQFVSVDTAPKNGNLNINNTIVFSIHIHYCTGFQFLLHLRKHILHSSDLKWVCIEKSSYFDIQHIRKQKLFIQTSSSFWRSKRSVSATLASFDEIDSRFNLVRSRSACCDICEMHWARKFS